MRHLIPILLTVAAALPALRAADRIESWVNTSVGQRFDYGLEARLEAEQWLSPDEPNYRHIEVLPQLVWHHSPRWDFAVGYEYDWTRMEDGGVAQAHNGFADATVKLALRRVSLTCRNRIMLGTENVPLMDGGSADRFVALWRARPMVEYEAPWMPLRLMPFASNETFYDLYNGFLAENRAQIGLAWRFNRVLRIEAYGMRVDRWDASGENLNFPVAGMNFSATF